jgi:hypothetical protein
MFVHSTNKHLNHKNRITTDLVFVTSDLYAEEEEEEEDGFACRQWQKKRDLEMVFFFFVYLPASISCFLDSLQE